MKQVIRIPDNDSKQEKVFKPIEFTHVYNSFKGWVNTTAKASFYEKIVYLGKCGDDGDMFAAYEDNFIDIFKGHLNDGVY